MSEGRSPRCPRCRGSLFSDGGRPFCFACGTLREWPDPRIYREHPSSSSGRRRRVAREAPRAGRPWTADEDAFLTAHLADMSLDELGEALGRTAAGVQTHLDLVLRLAKPYVRHPSGELVRGR